MDAAAQLASAGRPIVPDVAIARTALNQRPPISPSAVPRAPGDPPTLRRRDRFGGLIHEFEIAA